MLVFDELNALLHTDESSALIDFARQYADTEELEDFADRFITVEQPTRFTIFFMVLELDN